MKRSSKPKPSNSAATPPPHARRSAFEVQLASVVRFLGDEEVDLLLTIATRLWAGQCRYGPFDLARDRRNFQREALEEACDLAVYLAAAAHQDRRKRRSDARRPRAPVPGGLGHEHATEGDSARASALARAADGGPPRS
jgi:hypothetical protein